MDKPQPEPPIHVIDFEGDRRCGVVEFGVATLNGRDIAGTVTRLCRPREPLRPEDAYLHGIRDAAVVGAAAFEVEFERFRDLRATGPFCAHHASVEMGLLKQTWPYPPKSPDFSRPPPGHPVSSTCPSAGETAPPETTAASLETASASALTADWGPWLDTRQLYASAYPQMASHKLAALIAELGLQPVLDAVSRDHCPAARMTYHCALYDALACALLLLAFRDQPPPAFEHATIAALIRASHANAAARNEARQGRLFEG